MDYPRTFVGGSVASVDSKVKRFAYLSVAVEDVLDLVETKDTYFLFKL
jgi:hypothetical protein